MTTEEIKEQVTMTDVLTRYGITVNRSGMCHCPFHGSDKHPSMKIYRDGYNCFTCHANGDVFSFVQQMDGCGFKQAYLSLGGEYQQPLSTKDKKHAQWAKYEREQAKKRKEREQEQIKQEIKECSDMIDLLFDVIQNQEPLSDVWCEATGQREIYLAKWEELRKEVS